MIIQFKANAGLDVYKAPEEDHDYVMTVDVARGVGEDYSAFVVLILQNSHIKLLLSIEIMI